MARFAGMTSSPVLYEASQPGASSVLGRTLAAILNRCFQNGGYN